MQQGYSCNSATRSDGGRVSNYGDSGSFTMPPNDVTLILRFKYHSQCGLSISNDTDWSGTITVTGNAGYSRSFSISAWGSASGTMSSSNTSIRVSHSGGSWSPRDYSSSSYNPDGYRTYSVGLDYSGG